MNLPFKIARRCFFLVLIFLPLFSHGIENNNDSITHLSNSRANKCALMSAVVPGLGQIYNHKYWKVPVIYGTAGVLYYFIHTNNTEYKNFKQALIYRNDEDPLTIDNYPRLTNDDLNVRKDYYRRNRDLSYILITVLYTLNIIDAYVDSQLLTFDVSDKLSLVPGSNIQTTIDGSPVACMKLVLHFK